MRPRPLDVNSLDGLEKRVTPTPKCLACGDGLLGGNTKRLTLASFNLPLELNQISAINGFTDIDRDTAIISDDAPHDADR